MEFLLKYLLFFTVFILISLLIDSTVFFSFSKLFNITNTKILSFFAWFLGITSLSFFILSILGNFYENFVTRLLYFASALIFGFLGYLFLISLFGWIVFGLIKFLGYSLNSYNFGIILLFLAFVITSYSFWNSYQIKIKKISISIPNLSSSWKGEKAVQISDIHLGQIRRVNFLEDVITKVNQIKPEIIFITGDLFDGSDGDLSIYINSLNKLNAPKGIYFITGNHEQYLGTEKAFNIFKKTKIKILNDESVLINGLQIVGLSYKEGNFAKEIQKSILESKNYKEGIPTILLNHVPLGIYDAANTGVNLMLSGHTHRGQIFPFNYITNLIYNGFDYGLHKIGSFYIYTSSGIGTWGPPLRSGSSSEIVEIDFW